MEINSSPSDQPAGKPTPTAHKRLRFPDPDSEVIALSPRTLLDTKRFVCEVCSKDFPRDQNLQIHLRCHNLPEKIRQRTARDLRKLVYVCPDPGCIHHDPSRALRSLNAIKTHFRRKYGEKKHECQRCSKKYAVHYDFKAHLKICGTKDHLCDCGIVFTGKDTFLSHRQFCLATNYTPPPTTYLSSPVPSVQSSGQSHDIGTPSSTTADYVSVFNQSSRTGSLMCSMDGPGDPGSIDPISLSLCSSHYGSPSPLIPQPLSATALLQKAKQMSSNPYSFQHGVCFPVVPPPLGLGRDNVSATAPSHDLKNLMASELRIGPPCSNELMMDKPTTLNFLGGLGMGGGVEAASSGALDMTDAPFAGVIEPEDPSTDRSFITC